jgi:hypothetical protein
MSPKDKVQTQIQDEKIPEENIHTLNDLKAEVHKQIYNELPTHVSRLSAFNNCRIEYPADYRVALITDSGLGVEMDHRQNDINYFTIEDPTAIDFLEHAEFIDEQDIKDRRDYHTISLFRSVWTDLVKGLSDIREVNQLHPR